MARITRVAKARKDQRNCSKCGAPIKRGDAYLWWANRIGRSSTRRNRCMKPSCYPRASDMTTSDKLSRIYAAQESVGDLSISVSDRESAEGAKSDVYDALMAAAEQIREVGQEYVESADNIVEGFGHDTYQSDEIREKGESLDGWADDIESKADEIQDIEDFDDQGLLEPDDEDLGAMDDEEVREAHEEALESLFSDYQEHLQDAVSVMDESPL